jgi:hypothetical protein
MAPQAVARVVADQEEVLAEHLPPGHELGAGFEPLLKNTKLKEKVRNPIHPISPLNQTLVKTTRIAGGLT